MAYTPPAYNLVSVTWQGEVAYAPPAYNAVNYDPSESSASFAITSSSTFAAVGFQAGVNAMAFAVTANASLSYLIEGWFPAVATFTSTSTLSGAGRKIDPREFSLAGTGAFNPRLGYGVAATFAISASTALDGVSSVNQGAFSSGGTTTTDLVGAWDGTSGGDFFLAPTSELSAVGQSTAEATTSITATASVSTDARAVWAVAYAISDPPVFGAVSATVLPTAYNMLMLWDIAPTLVAYSAFERPAVFSLASTTSTSFAGALKGDSTFAITGQTSTDLAGAAETTAPLVFEIVTRPRARFYSADGRDSHYTIAAVNEAVFEGIRVVAAHAVEAGFRVTAPAEFEPRANKVAQGVFLIDTSSRMSSYRGRDYDESESVYVYANTKPREVAIFIGA